MLRLVLRYRGHQRRGWKWKIRTHRQQRVR